jgi:hypothetical protein
MIDNHFTKQQYPLEVFSIDYLFERKGVFMFESRFLQPLGYGT